MGKVKNSPPKAGYSQKAFKKNHTRLFNKSGVKVNTKVRKSVNRQSRGR